MTTQKALCDSGAVRVSQYQDRVELPRAERTEAVRANPSLRWIRSSFKGPLAPAHSSEAQAIADYYAGGSN